MKFSKSVVCLVPVLFLALCGPPSALADSFECQSRGDTGVIQLQVERNRIGMCTIRLDEKIGGLLFKGESGIGARIQGANGVMPFTVVTPIREITFGFPEDYSRKSGFTIHGGMDSPTGFGPRVHPLNSMTSPYDCVRQEAPLACRPAVFQDPPNQPKEMRRLLLILREVARDHWTAVPTLTLSSPDRSDFRVAVIDGGRGDLHGPSGAVVTRSEDVIRETVGKWKEGWTIVPVYTNREGYALARKIFR